LLFIINDAEKTVKTVYVEAVENLLLFGRSVSIVIVVIRRCLASQSIGLAIGNHLSYREGSQARRGEVKVSEAAEEPRELTADQAVL